MPVSWYYDKKNKNKISSVLILKLQRETVYFHMFGLFFQMSIYRLPQVFLIFNHQRPKLIKHKMKCSVIVTTKYSFLNLQ